MIKEWIRKKQEEREKRGYSHILLAQETGLIWIITLSFIGLAYLCIINGYNGSLPWLTPLIGFPWTAYGVSQACYYKKSQEENTSADGEGIIYAKAKAEMERLAAATGEVSSETFSPIESEYDPNEVILDDPMI